MKAKKGWEILQHAQIYSRKCPVCESYFLRKIAGHKNKDGTYGFAGRKPPKWLHDDYFDCWICDNCKAIVREKKKGRD